MRWGSMKNMDLKKLAGATPHIALGVPRSQSFTGNCDRLRTLRFGFGGGGHGALHSLAPDNSGASTPSSPASAGCQIWRRQSLSEPMHACFGREVQFYCKLG